MYLMRLNQKDTSGIDFILLIANLMHSAPGSNSNQLKKVLMFMQGRSIDAIGMQCLTAYKFKIVPYHITFDAADPETGCAYTHIILPVTGII